MNKAILLYSDFGLSNSNISTAVRECFDADNFNRGNELRNQILKETPLAIRAKIAMDKGERVSDADVDMLIENFIASSSAKTIVFSNYVFTNKIYERLDVILTRHNYSIDKILVFLQLDPEDFLHKYLQERITDEYFTKFGNESIESWKLGFKTRSHQVTEVLKSKWCLNCYTIKMPYEVNLSSELILKLLKDYA